MGAPHSYHPHCDALNRDCQHRVCRGRRIDLSNRAGSYGSRPAPSPPAPGGVSPASPRMTTSVTFPQAPRSQRRRRANTAHSTLTSLSKPISSATPPFLVTVTWVLAGQQLITQPHQDPVWLHPWPAAPTVYGGAQSLRRPGSTVEAHGPSGGTSVTHAGGYAATRM